jgi:hypothetical protein
LIVLHEAQFLILDERTADFGRRVSSTGAARRWVSPHSGRCEVLVV